MTQELEQRRRGNSILNRVSPFRSRPSSSSSSTKPFNVAPYSSHGLSATPTPLPLLPDKFEYFTHLPLELQAYILTFVPSRTLHKTIGRTNRFYKGLVESHIRRRVLTLMSPGPWDVRSTADNYKANFKKMPDNVLVFEAQRPIDTLTTKHTLYFSHFSRTMDNDNMHGNGSSTLVHFSFVPVVSDSRRSQSADSAHTSSSSGQSGGTASSNASLPSPLVSTRTPLAGTFGRPHYPIVHEQDRERLVHRVVTSSVNTPSRSQTSTPRAQNNRRLFTDVSSPMEWRETSVNPTRFVTDEEESDQVPQLTAAAIQSQANAARGRGYEGFDSTAPQLTGTWSEPIASSSAAYDQSGESNHDRSTEHRPQQNPTYRFQLDPLDSFETWILSLTLQRKSSESRRSSRSPTHSKARPMRWEKRVAEGLDRVFRDWFNPKGDGIDVSGSSWSGTNSALHRASLIASMGSGHSSSMPTTSQISMGKGREEEEEQDWQGAEPDSRMLEFDGMSCTMMIQPHPNSASPPSHPALTSMSSHHYLSNSSLSSQYHASLTSRVEFTFHCESLTINAARLLGVLEDVERDVDRASDMASKRGASIVAGSSGGTTWAYSTGGSNYATSENTTSTRWTADGPGGVSVLVFGAARD